MKSPIPRNTIGIASNGIPKVWYYLVTKRMISIIDYTDTSNDYIKTVSTRPMKSL